MNHRILSIIFLLIFSVLTACSQANGNPPPTMELELLPVPSGQYSIDTPINWSNDTAAEKMRPIIEIFCSMQDECYVHNEDAFFTILEEPSTQNNLEEYVDFNIRRFAHLDGVVGLRETITNEDGYSAERVVFTSSKYNLTLDRLIYFNPDTFDGLVVSFNFVNGSGAELKKEIPEVFKSFIVNAN